MERRQTPRTPVKQETWLRWLDAASDLSETVPPRCPARLEDSSSGGARFFVPHPYPVGACVEILVNDQLWLGEVVWRASAGGGYLVGVAVEQRLNRLADMENLCRRLLPDARRSQAGGEFTAAGTATPQPAQQSVSP